MKKQIRQIEGADLTKISYIMGIVFLDSDYNDMRGLGGMTNRSYCVKCCNGEEYLI